MALARRLQLRTGLFLFLFALALALALLLAFALRRLLDWLVALSHGGVLKAGVTTNDKQTRTTPTPTTM